MEKSQLSVIIKLHDQAAQWEEILELPADATLADVYKQTYLRKSNLLTVILPRQSTAVRVEAEEE